jgi:hypothetical protein
MSCWSRDVTKILPMSWKSSSTKRRQSGSAKVRLPKAKGRRRLVREGRRSNKNLPLCSQTCSTVRECSLMTRVQKASLWFPHMKGYQARNLTLDIQWHQSTIRVGTGRGSGITTCRVIFLPRFPRSSAPGPSFLAHRSPLRPTSSRRLPPQHPYA